MWLSFTGKRAEIHQEVEFVQDNLLIQDSVPGHSYHCIVLLSILRNWRIFNKEKKYPGIVYVMNGFSSLISLSIWGLLLLFVLIV